MRSRKKSTKKEKVAVEEWADVRMRTLKKCASVLCGEKVGETEAMVIERTMLEIAANLPAVQYRKRYGI